MRALIDSGLWWRRYHGLPLSRRLTRFLEEEVGEFWLCPISVQEMLYKWRHRQLPAPDPAGWLAEATSGYRLAPVTFEAGRIAGLWEWPHGDPVDRLLAAVAQTEGLTLVHTDQRLRPLIGFPQRYFPNVGIE
ncbi:MAG: PIN domain-containing protein [Verrucomicrobiae bacterium]|nr:PIN domain-containing protein [Verrucomicrobiae bacterium]